MAKEAEIMETPKTAECAHIGKSVIVKGELSGSEDLYIDGQVEGSIELSGNRLIIGPHGQVRANVNAKGVVVQGSSTAIFEPLNVPSCPSQLSPSVTLSPSA